MEGRERERRMRGRDMREREKMRVGWKRGGKRETSHD